MRLTWRFPGSCLSQSVDVASWKAEEYKSVTRVREHYIHHHHVSPDADTVSTAGIVNLSSFLCFPCSPSLVSGCRERGRRQAVGVWYRYWYWCVILIPWRGALSDESLQIWVPRKPCLGLHSYMNKY